MATSSGPFSDSDEDEEEEEGEEVGEEEGSDDSDHPSCRRGSTERDGGQLKEGELHAALQAAERAHGLGSFQAAEACLSEDARLDRF